MMANEGKEKKVKSRKGDEKKCMNVKDMKINSYKRNYD
jgi:hypothetical protein